MRLFSRLVKAGSSPVNPLISLVLPVKNGLPHLKKTIEAIRHQRYRNFELLIQDGVSTDGSLEFVSSLNDLPRVEVVSAPDSGIGQAYNRALGRSRGDLVCFLASDEYLYDDALERGVDFFRRCPGAAVIYGKVDIVDDQYRHVQTFVPPPFKLRAVMKCEIVPTTNGFFNRRVIGEDLYLDESVKTCPDYDLWLRLGSRFSSSKLVNFDHIFSVALGTRASASFRVESFDQFCADKLFILNRFLDTQPTSRKIEALRRSASAGIFLWGAEMLLLLESPSERFFKFCQEAARLDPQSKRLARLLRQVPGAELDVRSGRISLPEALQPKEPIGRTEVEGTISLRSAETFREWVGATIDHGDPVRITTSATPWAHSSLLLLNLTQPLHSKKWYWVRLRVRVIVGSVGIGILTGRSLLNERICLPTDKSTDVFIPLPQSTPAPAVMIRNGGVERPSVIDLYEASVESTPKHTPESTESGRG